MNFSANEPVRATVSPDEMITELQQFVPIGLLVLVATGVTLGMLLTPWIIGKKRVHNPVKDSPYECGMPAMTGADARFSVKFYLVAMLFIVFDIEVVFLLGWSAVFRDLIRPVSEGGIGLEMLLGALVFLAILEVGHIYAWKKGALDWAPKRLKPVAAGFTPAQNAPVKGAATKVVAQ